MITVNERVTEKKEFKPFIIEITINSNEDCIEMIEALGPLIVDGWNFAKIIQSICQRKLL